MVHAMSACSVRSSAVMPGQTATSTCSSRSSQDARCSTRSQLSRISKNCSDVGVDVLTDDGLSPLLQQQILAEAAALCKPTAAIVNTSATHLDESTQCCGNDHDAFIGDRLRQDATLRKLQVIGQAVKNLSEHTKSHAPEIPWKICRW